MESDILRAVLWTALGYLSGSLMFSVWLPKLFLKKNVREFGDGNPGATNAWKAGGWKIGIPAALLDYLKGAIPVGLAHFQFGVSGWWLVPVALAPALGHGFSPFLRFRGGNAVATTLGVWTGLTLWEGPSVLGGFFGLTVLFIDVDIWVVLFSMLAFLGYVIPKILLTGDWFLGAVWLGNVLFFAIKYIRRFNQPIRLGSIVGRLLKRKK